MARRSALPLATEGTQESLCPIGRAMVTAKIVELFDRFCSAKIKNVSELAIMQYLLF